MKAKYDVEVAKLDASKSEVVSKIEGAEAKLKLADAERALRQAEEQLKSDTAVDGATIQGKKNANRKAEFDAQRAETALSSMTLKAPSDGTVSLLSVWHNGGEGPFKAGERAWPGTPIAELPDPASMRVAARADETERGRLALSQPVTLQLDAIPDRQFTGKIEHIGTIATSDFSAGWPIPRNFDLEISIHPADPRLKARDDRGNYCHYRPHSKCHHDSGTGVFPQIRTDHGLRLEWICLPGTCHSGRTKKPRPHPGCQRFETRRAGGPHRSFGEGVRWRA